MPVDFIPSLIKQLYGIVNELEERFPGRKFTPDGHLVGSIGEVLAAHYYGLELLDNSYERHDAITRCHQMAEKCSEKNPNSENCISGSRIYHGDGNYMLTVKWDDFIGNPDHYIAKAYQIQDKQDNYDIRKEI